MDPISAIGFAASLSTITEVACHLGKVSYKLCHAARDKGAVEDDVVLIANDMGVAADCFDIALKTLRKKNIFGQNSEVIKYLRRHHTLAKLNQSAKQIKRRLKGLSAWIEKLDGKLNIWKSFKWMYQLRPSVAQTMGIVQSLHGSISIILASAQLEINQHDASKTTDPVFKSRLVEDSDLILDRLEVIEKRLLAFEQIFHSPSNSASRRHKSDRTVNALVNLSSSLRHDGCVPGGHRASIQTSSTSLESAHSPASTSTRPTSLDDNARSSMIDHIPSPAGMVSVIDQPQERNWQSLNDSDGEVEASSESDEDLVNKDCQFHEKDSEHPTHGHVEVIPQHSMLVVDTSVSQAVTLHYKSGSTSQHAKTVTGKVLSNLSDNIMSYTMATKLGIAFEDIVEGDPPFIDFSNGRRRRVLGRTGLIRLHKTSSMSHKWLNLQFWVYEHYELEMILGQQFAKHREYYWDKTTRRMPTQ